jgi:hypothetical protein
MGEIWQAFASGWFFTYCAYFLFVEVLGHGNGPVLAFGMLGQGREAAAQG